MKWSIHPCRLLLGLWQLNLQLFIPFQVWSNRIMRHTHVPSACLCLCQPLSTCWQSFCLYVSRLTNRWSALGQWTCSRQARGQKGDLRTPYSHPLTLPLCFREPVPGNSLSEWNCRGRAVKVCLYKLLQLPADLNSFKIFWQLLMILHEYFVFGLFLML